MYVSAGDAMRAVKLLGDHQGAGWAQQLAAIARALSASRSRMEKYGVRVSLQNQ